MAMEHDFSSGALRAAMVWQHAKRKNRTMKLLLDSFDEDTLDDLGFSRRIGLDHTQSLADLDYYTVSEKGTC